MSSEYTSDLETGKNVTLADFVMKCAKVMLPVMRDWPLDAVIPDKFEASTYHAEEAKKASTEADCIKAWCDAEADQEAQLAYDRAVEGYQESLASKAALRTHYDAMLAQVNAWTPPTPDHRGLKDFMIKQLQDSINYDCSTEYLPAPERLTGQAYKELSLASALRNVEYHTRENTRVQERAKANTAWVQALRQSLAELPTP